MSENVCGASCHVCITGSSVLQSGGSCVHWRVGDGEGGAATDTGGGGVTESGVKLVLNICLLPSLSPLPPFSPPSSLLPSLLPPPLPPSSSLPSLLPPSPRLSAVCKWTPPHCQLKRSKVSLYLFTLLPSLPQYHPLLCTSPLHTHTPPSLSYVHHPSTHTHTTLSLLHTSPLHTHTPPSLSPTYVTPPHSHTTLSAGEEVLPFFWLDAYEDPSFHQHGTVYLFGKVWVPAVNTHVR